MWCFFTRFDIQHWCGFFLLRTLLAQDDDDDDEEEEEDDDEEEEEEEEEEDATNWDDLDGSACAALDRVWNHES